MTLATASPKVLKEIEQHQFTFLERRSCQGVKALEVIVPSCPCPVACVWYRFCGHHTIEILNSFVSEPYRRLGLRTAIHRYLCGYTKVRRIISGAGTADGSAWMTATGYQMEEEDWVFTVTDEARAEAKKFWGSVQSD